MEDARRVGVRRQCTADAEHINAYGMRWRGRDEIAGGIGYALAVVYPDNPHHCERHPGDAAGR